MNPNWVFNGTMEAHHLTAAYLLVWALQGGYAVWVTRQLLRLRKASHAQDKPLPKAER